MKIENLTVRFGDKLIFDSFNCLFKDNGIYVINGASGKGKTTLFNVIAGVLKPDSGKVDLEGEKVSYMFQEDRLFPDFSVFENVFCVTHQTQDDARLCKEVLAKLGLSNELDSYPKGLSGGMQRRVALARALVFNADILLLDEAFKGLDEETCKTAINIVLEYTKDKLVIVSAHMLDRNLFGNYTEIDI